MYARFESFRTLALVTASAACLSAGCGQAKDGGATVAPATTSDVAATDQATTQPKFVIDEEAEQFARQIAEGVNSGNPSTIQDALDYNVMMDRVAVGLDVSRQYRHEFLTGLRTVGSKLDQQFAGAIVGGGSFRFLRLRMKDGEPRALYRLLLPDEGGVNYLDLLFVRSRRGNARIGDIYLFLVGEDISQTMRRVLISAMQHENRNILQRLTGQEDAFIKHISEFRQMSDAVKLGDGVTALQIYRAMPPDLQQNRLVLGLRLLGAQSVSDEEYLEAIAALRRKYSDDPSIYLILIDSYTLRGEYQQALESIDALDQALGGDPYLHVLRAKALLEMGDLTAAGRAAEQAVALAPDLVEATYVALDVALADRRFDNVLRLLESLLEDYGLEYENLRDEPVFAEFVDSPQYQTWLQQHPTQAEPAEELSGLPVE